MLDVPAGPTVVRRRPRASIPVRAGLAALLTAVLTVVAMPIGRAAPAPPQQPPAPTSGPGGTATRYAEMRVGRGGAGADGFYVFAPAGSERGPMPRSLPLVIVMHGYFEYWGYRQLAALVRHTVLAGNVVIYPRWQTDVATPCPGPYDIAPCLDSATAGIRGGLRFLAAHRAWVQPRLDQASWFGFSFGGIITADLANRWRELSLPRPRAIFLDDPHDGGLAGAGEPALDDDLAGIPRSTRFVCHSGADGVISEPGKARSSCNAVFPRLTSIPRAQKVLVLTRTDTHGAPLLSSAHGVCAARPGQADAYDWNFCWRVWDATRSDALHGTRSPWGPARLAGHRGLGRWSDGVPVLPLVVRHSAPIAG